MPSIKSFDITLGDINYLLAQMRQAIFVVRYDIDGHPVYAYKDSAGNTHELGLFGTFDPLGITDPTTGLSIYDGAREASGFRVPAGFFNNLMTATSLAWGAVNDPFPRLTVADYNHYVHQVIADPAHGVLTNPALVDYAANHPGFTPVDDNSTNYADLNKTVVDYTPRMITQTITTSYANGALDRTGTATDTITSQVKDAQGVTHEVTENIVRNLNTLPGDPSTSGIFTLFGQFFDHGLDFIDKGGQGAKVIIPLAPDDPLYSASPTHTITISRATPNGYTMLDAHGRQVSIAGADGVWNTGDEIQSLGADGVLGGGDDTTGHVSKPATTSYTDHTSPYIDQSQSYGSDTQITALLRQWVLDPNHPGQYRPGAELLDGHHTQIYSSTTFSDAGAGHSTRTIPTLEELRAHLLATGRSDLTWDDINNYRVRDAQGQVIDTNGATPGGYVYTGQAILLDMNPHFDNVPGHLKQADVDALNSVTGASLHFYGALAGETDTASIGQLTDGTNLGAFALAPWINFANFSITTADPAVYSAVSNLLVDAVGDHYIAGDGRANENFGLTALHHVFHENHNVQLANLETNILAQADLASRHNLQVAVSNGSGGFYTDADSNYLLSAGGAVSWDPDKMFEAAKLINEMEYQHVAIDQYARLVTPDLPEFVTYDNNINADISLEYSQAAFRFGHSQLRETIDAIDPNGLVTKFALSGAFLNPAQFAAVGAADIVRGMSQQLSNDVDEFVTPAMQQSLLGQPLDLAAINIARGRDLGIPTLNEVRRQLHDALVAERAADPTTPHHSNLIVDALNPYTSWAEFGSQMQHPESLVNFIAAYSFDGDLTKAQAIVGLENGSISEGSPQALGFTVTNAITFLNGGDDGYNRIDLWIGGLAELHVFTGQLGTTFNAIFEDQMERLMDGDRFYYLYRLGVALPIFSDLNQSIVTEQFKDIIERTTGVTHLNGDVMGFADSNIELARTADTSRPLLAVRGEQILDIEGHLGPANMGDLKYDATHNVITQSYKTAHAYGDILVAHPGMGIYSGSGNGTAGNGTILAKSNTDLGFVNQQYIADFRPDMGENPDGTPASGYNSHEVIAGTDNNDWIDAGNGDDTVYGDKGNDVLDGKAGADHLYGGDGQDVLYGGDIEDFLDGGRGDDIIYAGTSAGALDVVIGGAGNDKLYGEAGIDEIYGGAGDDYIDAGGDTDLAFGDAGNDIMFGGDGPDELRGGLGDDILSGGSAADMLLGEGGDDIFFGGLGQAAQTGDSDEDLGGDGFDIAAYSDVTIVLDVPADLRNLGVVGAVGGTAANPFNQLLTEIEGVIGSKFNDRIIGADAGTGADGQPTGDNWLIGGGGADTFNTTVANAAGSIGQGGNDVIIGDTIRLDTLIGSYGANSYLNGTDALGNATHNIDGTLGQGLLGNSTLGTTMFAKHFTDLIKTERNKDMVLGQDGGGAGDDTVIYSGNRADYSVTVIDFDTAPANPSPHITIKAYKIVDLRSGSPDGTDLVVGVESFQFADRTLNETQMQNHAPTGTLSFSPGESGNNAVLTPISALFDQENISLPGNPLGAVTPSYNWQTSTDGDTWLTIPSGNGSGQQSVGTNILRQAQTAGKLVRLVASYTDAALNPESVAQTWNLVVGTSANNNLLIGTASLVIGDVIFGLGGNDTISGLAGDDQLYGGAGNDALDGGTGADVMAGGSGNDIYVVENADDVVTEAAGAGTDTINTSLSSYTLLANFENLLYSGTSTFAGTGNAAVNSITGGAGNDTLNGAGGNDTLLGLGGDDTYTVDNAGVTIVEAAAGGTDTVRTSLASYTLAANLENLTYTGLGNFIGNGNALDNVIIGGAGNDTLDGKTGADTLIGLGGNDLYFVDNPSDVVQEAVNDGTDRVSTALGSLTLGDNVENLTHTGSTPFIGNGNILDNVITGGTGSDTLNGLGGNDTLNGSSGNDTLDGGTGADVMAGGTGDDAYYVDDLADSVVENANSGTDIVSTSLSTLTLVANIENLVYTGPSNFAGTGNASANVILGAAGNDTLLGLAGGDTLTGGVGSDTLNGGAGSDVLNGGSGVDYFVFDTALGTGSTQSGVDTIDFVHGQDFIYLDNAIFTSLGASGGLQASFFVSNMTGSAGDTDDYVIYNSLNGWLTYDSNGSVLSGGINNHFATLQTGLALSSSDFLVI